MPSQYVAAPVVRRVEENLPVHEYAVPVEQNLRNSR